MEFAKLELTREWNSYTCTKVSNIKMGIVGILLSNDIRCDTLLYKQTLADDRSCGRGGNFISMDKEDGYVLLTDIYSEEEEKTEFKISQQQFVQLLDDWQEMVCKPYKPQEVIIKYENDQFIIETKD
jgi:hypothetical protein